MRWLILFLLIPTLLYADSLQVAASADGFIDDPGGTPGVYTFTISNYSSAATVANTYLNSTATLGARWYNYGISTTAICGKSADNPRHMLLVFPTLDDSIGARDPNNIAIIDSGIVELCINNFPGTADSLKLLVIQSNRNWNEGTADGATNRGASWANYDSIVGTAYPWTEAGGFGSDDTLGGIYDSSGWIAPATPSDSLVRFKVPGWAVDAYMNTGKGMIIKPLRYGTGATTATTQLVQFVSDDNSNQYRRPKLTVYYHIVDYNYGGSDSLIVRSSDNAKAIFDFSGLSALSPTVDLDSGRLWTYITANYSTGDADNPYRTFAQGAKKPVFIGNNNGTPPDAGEMSWSAWHYPDSNWGTIGAELTGVTCNRSDGSGADIDSQSTYKTTGLGWSGTGWKSLLIDTLIVRRYLDGCNNSAIWLDGVPGGSGLTHLKIEADEKSGSANITFLTVYYHAGAVAATVGTGRFGKLPDGSYGNVR